MFESLELELARREIKSYIENFAEETIIQESRRAQDCLDCEAFLSRGIKALAWVERGEEALFKGHAAGLFDVTPEIETAIDGLYESWMRPCSFAESWIAKCEENGYDISNLVQFQECCDRAREHVERAQRYKSSKSIRDERFAQEPW